METKGEDGVLSLQGVITTNESYNWRQSNEAENIPGSKLSFGSSEGMSKMQHTVHVGVGESGHETTPYQMNPIRTVPHSYPQGRSPRKASPPPKGLAF